MPPPAGPGARNLVAVGVVEAPQCRILQGAAAAVGALEVNDVGLASDELDGEPVEILGGLDFAGSGSAHDNGSSGQGIGRIIVSHWNLLFGVKVMGLMGVEMRKGRTPPKKG